MNTLIRILRIALINVFTLLVVLIIALVGGIFLGKLFIPSAQFLFVTGAVLYLIGIGAVLVGAMNRNALSGTHEIFYALLFNAFVVTLFYFWFSGAQVVDIDTALHAISTAPVAAFTVVALGPALIAILGIVIFTTKK